MCEIQPRSLWKPHDKCHRFGRPWFDPREDRGVGGFRPLLLYPGTCRVHQSISARRLRCPTIADRVLRRFLTLQLTVSTTCRITRRPAAPYACPRTADTNEDATNNAPSHS